MSKLAAAATLAALTAPALQAHAQTPDAYPTKPIRLVVPFSPGGSSDTIGRTIGIKLTEISGQQLVIDNRPGANGNIGMQVVADATPDGYTLVLGYIANLAINPSLYRKLPYDALKGYAAITQLTSSPNILAVHPQVAARSVQELVALARQKPGYLNYASGGVGTIGHMSTELLAFVSGTKMQHIAYKGSGQAVIDLLAGQVQLMFSGMPAVLPHARAGRLRALGVTSLARSPAAPDVPTIAESGYAGFEAIGWFGVLAPAATPRPLVDRIHQLFVKAATSQEVKDKLGGVGFDIVTNRPEEFAAYIRSEHAKWAKVVKSAGIKAEGT